MAAHMHITVQHYIKMGKCLFLSKIHQSSSYSTPTYFPSDPILMHYVFLKYTITHPSSPSNHCQGNRVDTSYFAPDHFHFSVKGHKEIAVALWNNMVSTM